jgi:hypothetical protein
MNTFIALKYYNTNALLPLYLCLFHTDAWKLPHLSLLGSFLVYQMCSLLQYSFIDWEKMWQGATKDTHLDEKETSHQNLHLVSIL